MISHLGLLNTASTPKLPPDEPKQAMGADRDMGLLIAQRVSFDLIDRVRQGTTAAKPP